MISNVERERRVPLMETRADYEIAKRNSRFRRRRPGVTTVGQNGDYHYNSESDFLYALEYARDLDRNDIFAGMCIDRVMSNVLGEAGIQPDPSTGDKNLDAALKEEWIEWSQNEALCDLAKEHTFGDLERVIFRETLVSGDCCALANEGGGVEVMEAHRLRTPSNTKRNIVHGVELSPARVRLNYLFTKDELDPRTTLRKVSDTIAVPTRDDGGYRQVFHVYNPQRVSLTRGVSVFRRCADTLGMHDDIEFANLVRQQIASCFVLVRQRTEDYKGPATNYGDRTTVGGRAITNIQPGAEVRGEVGEKIEGFSPNIPGDNFFEHAQLLLKLISANLNLPLHAVLLDASQTNFSGWRGAADEARNGFREIQRWLVRRLHAPLWQWKVRDWIASSPALQRMANEVPNATKVKWKWPRWKYIEPLKDTAANAGRVKSGQASLRTIHSENGGDLDDFITETVEDNAMIYMACRDKARELNQAVEDDSEKITWRELLVMPLHEGLTITLNGQGDNGGTNG